MIDLYYRENPLRVDSALAVGILRPSHYPKGVEQFPHPAYKSANTFHCVFEFQHLLVPWKLIFPYRQEELLANKDDGQLKADFHETAARAAFFLAVSDARCAAFAFLS